MGIGAKLYCLWATAAICLAVALAGRSPESITRLLVIAFLFCQIAWRSILVQALPWFSPKVRFILLGTILALVVEGFHMLSKPVFLSLRIGWDTSFTQGLLYYMLDLLFTVPAYLAIFSVIWYFINRFHYPLWHYIVLMGLAQALGDGGLFFFFSAPPMLLFLPYPMTNYHAINIIPFLAVRDRLRHERSSSAIAYLAVPAVIGTYLICGTIIKFIGRAFGLE
ncbi:hypothetical protein TUMEXPCC7403_13050 [Tumidithrix helvetica PCC 7403]|uniref:hypothetical protein n=1 Tax=Tumidithrix helvetica TaxID=3457545 RepID=UPI003CB18AFB